MYKIQANFKNLLVNFIQIYHDFTLNLRLTLERETVPPNKRLERLSCELHITFQVNNRCDSDVDSPYRPDLVHNETRLHTRTSKQEWVETAAAGSRPVRSAG